MYTANAVLFCFAAAVSKQAQDPQQHTQAMCKAHDHACRARILCSTRDTIFSYTQTHAPLQLHPDTHFTRTVPAHTTSVDHSVNGPSGSSGHPLRHHQHQRHQGLSCGDTCTSKCRCLTDVRHAVHPLLAHSTSPVAGGHEYSTRPLPVRLPVLQVVASGSVESLLAPLEESVLDSGPTKG
jgi:hypothetical protein